MPDNDCPVELYVFFVKAWRSAVMTGYFVMNYELKFAILMNDPTSAALISGVAP